MAFPDYEECHFLSVSAGAYFDFSDKCGILKYIFQRRETSY